MLELETLNKKYETDVAHIRELFCELMRSLSYKERRENFRLKRRARLAIFQLGLCRELARSLESEICS